jgi:hypothetical protein
MMCMRQSVAWCALMIGGAFSSALAEPAPVKVLARQPGLSFVRFVDSRENAFSTEVPKGWKTSGGLFRFAPVDPRGAVESLSPENDIRVTAGDAELPPFTLPNPTLAMAGFREGSWYSPGYGVRMMVRRYLPGAAAATEYVKAMVAPRIACSGLTVGAPIPRPELTQAMNVLYAQLGQAGMSLREDAGEVRFDCSRDGQPWKGYYLVVTLLSSGAGGGIWHVEHVLGYAAAAAKVPKAEAAMLHLAASMQVNPDWVQMQQGVTMATSRIVAKVNQEISGTIRKTFENRQRTVDETSRRDANARRGVTDLFDPETGESWTVQNGSRYYWHKPGSDVMLGTETFDRPGVGYELLRER